MVQFYSRLFLLFVVCFSSSISHTQVSVTATAGNRGPAPYTTLKRAFDAINDGSHLGAITLTVTANTTETASAILKGSGSGAASYNSVLIKAGARAEPVIAAALSNSLIVLDGARNVTIDGSNTVGGTTKNLTISNDALAGSALIFLNGASNNTVKNTVLRAPTRTTGVIVVSTSTAAEGNNNNTIENNDITRSEVAGAPFIGIHNVGTSGKPNTGNVYRNNRIFNFLYFGFMDGDDFGTVGYSNNTLFEGNELFSTTAQPSNIIAIFISNARGISNMTISKNKIHSLTADGPFEAIIGIMLLDAVSVTVVNNMISLADNKYELRGISQETGAGSTIKIYNNTILISGATTGSIRSFALFKNWFSTGDEIRNNMFINTRVSSGTGRQYAFIKFNAGTFTSDYNNLVSTGNALNMIGGSSTTDAPTLYTTFDQWKTGTGQDAHSISVNPVFVSATDLHLVPADNASIDNKGTPIAAVTTDIDGETRSTATPDMGADEFTSTTTAISRIDVNINGVVLMPNVVDRTAVLRVRAARAMKINWTLVNIQGQQVKVFSSQVSAGVNDIELELAGLSTGIYQLIGHTSKGSTELIRLIKR